MNLKALSILLIFALTYFLTYFYKAASGLLFYYVQTVAYTAVILLTWNEAREHLKYGHFTAVISFFMLNYLLVYVALGFWNGFGLTPYSTSLTGVVINVVHTTSRIFALEFLRVYTVSGLVYRCKRLALYAPTLIVWFLTWFPYPLLSLTRSMESLKLVFRYLIPSFISSAFSTFIVLNHGIVPSIVYNLAPQVFIKVMPVLPRLDWFIEGTVNTVAPLVGYSIALPYSKVTRKNIRKVRNEVESTIKLIGCFAVLVALIVVLQGYVGFRFYVIFSRSMEPALNVGDIVVTCNYCKDTNVGDIVAYVSKWGLIVHRVVELHEDQRYVVTKGDANRDPDLEPVPFENILGKVVLRIPILGYISIFVHEVFVSNLRTLPLVLLFAIPIVAYIFKRL